MEFLQQPVTVHKQVLTGRWHMGVAIESVVSQVMSRLDLFKTICCWFVSDVLKMPNIKDVEHCCQVIEHKGLVELYGTYTDHVLYDSAIGDCIGLFAKDELTPALYKHIWKEGVGKECVTACFSGVGCASNLIKEPHWSWITDYLGDVKLDYRDVTWPSTRRVVECVDRVCAFRSWILHHHSCTPEETDGLKRLMVGHFKIDESCKDDTFILNPKRWEEAYEHQGGCTWLLQHTRNTGPDGSNRVCIVGTKLSHSVLGFGVLNITIKELD
jgi:hypothetical protein